MPRQPLTAAKISEACRSMSEGWKQKNLSFSGHLIGVELCRSGGKQQIRFP